MIVITLPTPSHGVWAPELLHLWEVTLRMVTP